MNFFESWKNLLEKVQNMSYKDLEGWKYLIMILLISDLFGVYWYLGAKKLGIALMLVLMAALTFILLVGGDKQPPKPKINRNQKEVTEKMDEDVKEDKEDQKEEEEEDSGLGVEVDLGLGSAEEYQKRVDKALGTGF